MTETETTAPETTLPETVETETTQTETTQTETTQTETTQTETTTSCGACADGQACGAAGVCEAILCATHAPAHGSVNDGFASGSIGYGESDSYACDPGYILTGTAPTCGGTANPGTLSGPEPTCAPVICTAHAPANGSVNGGTADASVTVGTFATYACDAGFVLAGSAPICGGTSNPGVFSGAEPTCTAITCTAHAPAHGSVAGSATTASVAYGASDTYACDPGYLLSGTAPTCGGTANPGILSGAEPTCVATTCTAHAPAHGTMNGGAADATLAYPSTASYACDQGYGLMGTAPTCSSTTDGELAGAEPTCVALLAPVAVTATTNLTSKVSIAWQAAAGSAPTGYIVRRDGAELVTLEATQLSYDDTTAGGLTITSAPQALTASTDRTDGVYVSWTAAGTTTQTFHYDVVALYGASRSPASTTADGRRDVSASYEWSSDAGTTWTSVGNATSFLDTSAPQERIDISTTVRPDYNHAVVLLMLDAVTRTPASVHYRVRVVSPLDSTGQETSTSGARTRGPLLGTQWQRSAGDSDQGYTDLSAVRDTRWYDASPANGERYYRIALKFEAGVITSMAVPAELPGFKQIAIGNVGPGIGNHVCGLRKDDGTMICWNAIDGEHATSMEPAGSFKRIAVTTYEVCATRASDDGLVCSSFGSVGPSTPPAGPFTQIASGQDHMCGIRTDGRVACWSPYSLPGPKVTDAPDGQFLAVAAVQSASCAIAASDNTLVCWGSSYVVPHATFTQIAAGLEQFCAVGASEGTVFCWGPGGVLVAPSGIAFGEIASGDGSACGLGESDGKLRCWGSNDYGEAPTGPSALSYEHLASRAARTCVTRASDGRALCFGKDIPALPSDEAFDDVAAGYGHTCGLRSSDHALVCWGTGEWMPPTGPSTYAYAQVASAAAAAHTCAIRASDESLECFGDDSHGQATPPAGAFTSVAVGDDFYGDGFSCGIRATDGKLACWGTDTDHQATPPQDAAYDQVTCGSTHACAIRTSDGHVVCWGANTHGELAVPSTAAFEDVSAAAGITCGIRASDHHLFCWGDLQGWGIPAEPSADTFSNVSVGGTLYDNGHHMCAVHASDGHVECWGSWGDGESTPPTGVFSRVAAGEHHTCALRVADHHIVCWGKNDKGQAPQL